MSRRGGHLVLEEAMPEELVCHALGFLSVGDLVTRVTAGSKSLHRLTFGILGEDRTVLGAKTRVEPVPALAARYEALKSLRKLYQELAREQQGPRARSNGVSDEPMAITAAEDGHADATSSSLGSVSTASTASTAASSNFSSSFSSSFDSDFSDVAAMEISAHPNLCRALEALCLQFSDSRFGKIVMMDDHEIQIAAGVKMLQYRRHSVSFGKFVELHDVIHGVAATREQYLLQYFAFPGDELNQDDPGSPRKRARSHVTQRARENTAGARQSGALTSRGLAICDRIFDFFDVDGDNLLGWEELSAINQAAGLPLSLSAYLWVQASYETGHENRLTRSGYRTMFLENFVRVPRLMYKDLVRLTAYIDQCNREELKRNVLAHMQHHNQGQQQQEEQPQQQEEQPQDPANIVDVGVQTHNQAVIAAVAALHAEAGLDYDGDVDMSSHHHHDIAAAQADHEDDEDDEDDTFFAMNVDSGGEGSEGSDAE